jgi:hypothetical protein
MFAPTAQGAPEESLSAARASRKLPLTPFARGALGEVRNGCVLGESEPDPVLFLR